MHGAVNSLSSHEVKLGILVAATVHFGHAHNPSFAQLGVLSPDGACKSFDQDANGCIKIRIGGEGGDLTVRWRKGKEE
jgi:acyl transferase domain-containing protein